MNPETLATFRNLRVSLKEWRKQTFPFRAAVYVNCNRFHGYGLVDSQSDVPEDQLAVLLENGNVWWYPIDCCLISSQYDVMPSAIRLVVKLHKTKSRIEIEK